MTKVFFDGNCPICKKEINTYRKLSLDKKIEWHDISKNKNITKKINKTQNECLRVLHVVDDSNNLKTAIDAFIEIWIKTKYFRHLVIIFKIPSIKMLANYLYKIYAKYRYKKLYEQK